MNFWFITSIGLKDIAKPLFRRSAMAWSRRRWITTRAGCSPRRTRTSIARGSRSSPSTSASSSVLTFTTARSRPWGSRPSLTTRSLNLQRIGGSVRPRLIIFQIMWSSHVIKSPHNIFTCYIFSPSFSGSWAGQGDGRRRRRCILETFTFESQQLTI